MIKLFNEEMILDQAFRAKVIEDINSTENQARKIEAKKRYEVNKDNNAKYVMLKLTREISDPQTLAIMENRVSNISIGKKIINKLARVYQKPPTRTTGDENIDKQVSEIAALMNFNSKQKKLDRYTRLFRTCMAWFYPEQVGENQWTICQKILGPHQYDVLQSPTDPEQAGCVILSEFIEKQINAIPMLSGPQVNSLEARQQMASHSSIAVGGNAVPFADKAKQYIFWSNKYHFTTDENGVIISALSPDDRLNPIGLIPGVTSAQDQDGKYWAEGGEDIADGSILVNTMLTDKNAILFMQGWGQMVITGTHVPHEFHVGPHKALVLTYNPDKGEAEPKVTSVSSDPKSIDWLESVKQYVALLLSTNNLSPKTISANLDASDAASGIAMLIDRSETTDSIEDAQNEFYWIELKEWEVIKRWHNLFYSRRLLTKEFMNVGALPENLYVTPKFPGKTDEVVSEKDKLDNMKLKKELGLVDQIDLIMEANPGMTKEEAELKYKSMKEKEQVKEQSEEILSES